MKKYLALPTIIVFSIAFCNISKLTNHSFTFTPTEEYDVSHNKTEVTVSSEETFENLFQQANIFFKAEKFKEAAYCYKKALKLHPTCPHTFFNLGQAYFWQKKYPKALKAYQQTLKHKPNHVKAYAQIGKLLFEVRQYDDALHPLKRALEYDAYDAESRLLLVRSYSAQQQFSHAIELIQKGLELTPRDVNLRFEHANILNHLNQLDESLALYKELDQIAPNNPSIIYNIGYTLKKMGLTEKALVYYDKVLAMNPGHRDAHFSRGLAYLVLGDFEKGWEGYEWRYHKPEQGCLREFAQERWNGTDLTNKTILLHAEQGLGDTFQFIRYAQLIKETKNPKKIIAAIQKPLITLISLCPYVDEVVSVNDITTVSFDVQAPLMSLPHILKTTLDTIPCTIPYLFADEQLTQEWKKELDKNPNIKVGICVQGNENYATPHLRTTVALKSVKAQQLAPFCAVPGVSIYSLQKESGTDQFKNLPENMNIITFDGDFDNSHGRFMDTVAVIKNLDLVITVDTSISHLAAALGKPTWIMLPNPADWRWMQGRTDTPWYPSVRLFKQPKPGDWESMIAEVAQELTTFVENMRR